MSDPFAGYYGKMAPASSATTAPSAVAASNADPFASYYGQTVPSPETPPSIATEEPVRGLIGQTINDIVTRPDRTLFEAVAGAPLGAGRFVGKMGEGLGNLVEGVGSVFDRDEDPRTLNVVQRLGRIVRRKAEGLTEQADLVEMETMPGKAAKLVGEVGTDILATVAGARALKLPTIKMPSPVMQTAVNESLKMAIASAPATAAYSSTGESLTQAAAALVGDEELAQTLEGSMAKRVLADLALNTTLGLAMDAGLAKIGQIRAARQQAAKQAAEAAEKAARDAAEAAAAAAPRQAQVRALLANPAPKPGPMYDEALLPAIPMRGEVPPDEALARAAARGIPEPTPPPLDVIQVTPATPRPDIEVVEGYDARSRRTQAMAQRARVSGETEVERMATSGRVLQIPDEEATKVLEVAKATADAQRAANPSPTIILSSLGAGQWEEALKNPAAREVIKSGGIVGVGLGMQQLEDERLSATGKDLVVLGVLSAMYPQLRSAGLKGAGNLRERMMASETGRKVLNAMSYDLTADPVLKDLATQYERMLAKGKALAAELSTKASALGPQADRRISDLIERESFEPAVGDLAPEALALAKRIADEFAEVGRLQVQAGVLSQSTLDRFNKQYLPRMYAKYMAEEAVGDVITVGTRKIRLREVLERADLTDDIRNALGEVREASVRTRIGLEEQYRRAATGMMFDQISKVPGMVLTDSNTARQAYVSARNAYENLVSRIKREGVEHLTPAQKATLREQRETLWQATKNAKAEYQRIGTLYTKPRDGYVRVPDSAGYGQLRGAVVRQDVADYLNMLPEMSKHNAWDGLLRFWKKSKTVYNLGTHVGNFVSNVSMAHMGGLPVTEVIPAIRNAWKAIKAYDPDVRYLAERGDLDRGLPMFSDPIVAGDPEEALRGLMETTRPQTRQVLEDAGFTPMTTIGREARGLDRWVVDIYAKGDGLFRVALFKKLKANGMADELAADFVRKQFVDYGTRSPALKLIGRYASPFVMFPAKAVPRMLDQVLQHPERWATLAMFWGLADQYTRRTVGPMSLDDLPEGERRAGYLVPGRVQLPATGPAGEFYTLDMARWTPFSALTGDAAPGTAVGQLDVGLPGIVSPSGPLADFGNLVMGRNAFTGEPLATASMTTQEKLQTYGLEILKFVAPTMLGVHAMNVKHSLEDLDKRAALINVFGVLGTKPRIVRPGMEAVYAEYEMNEALADAQKQMNARLLKAQLNPAKQERITLDYQMKLLMIQEKYLERIGAHEAAKEMLEQRNAMSSGGVQYQPR